MHINDTPLLASIGQHSESVHHMNSASATSMPCAAARRLVRELYLRKSGHVDPSYLLRRLAAMNAGENFCDGGQHDCEELLSAMMDRLHEDLVRRL